MSDKTRISWTEHTWNPWMGCRKVSAGCKNCYMFRDMKHYGKDPTTVRRAKTTFDAPLKWHTPAKVFTCSWSDWFIEDADPWRAEAWSIISMTPQLTYQILTKRTERIAECLPPNWGDGYPNVWLIATAENQEMADKRIPELLRVRAVVHGLSIEPMLGPIDLTHIPIPGGTMNVLCRASIFAPHILWVIVGGESGPDFRPMELDWARSIRDQCAAAGVAFFYKQGAGPRPGMSPTLDGVEYHQFPGGTR